MDNFSIDIPDSHPDIEADENFDASGLLVLGIISGFLDDFKNICCLTIFKEKRRKCGIS